MHFDNYIAFTFWKAFFKYTEGLKLNQYYGHLCLENIKLAASIKKMSTDYVFYQWGEPHISM